MDHFPSVKLWWDFFKNSLRAEIISFSKTKRKNLSHERVVLTNEVIKLKALLVAGDFSVSPVIRDLENKLLVLQCVLKRDGLKRGRNLLASSSGLSSSVLSEIHFFCFRF